LPSPLRPSRLIEKLTLELPRKLRDRAAARGPLPEPAAPADGGRGALPVSRVNAALPSDGWEGALALGNRTLAELSELKWDRCPETGAVLPTAHRAALDVEPGAWAQARRAHQHRWFSTLARTWAETGSVAHAVAATTALGEWLASDRPEVGVPWLHASDAAVRLVHWSLGAGWLGEELDADLWRRMAGSAQAHARHLEANLSLGSNGSDHRLVAQACGLVVAGLTWPSLDGARRWWSQGLTLLGRHLPGQLHSGGVPKDLSLSLLERTVTLALVARASCRANNVAFPADAESALARGAWLLRLASGDMDALPPIGQAVEPPLAAWGAPTATTPWNVMALSLEGEDGTPVAATDRSAIALAGEVATPGEVLARDKEWVMFALRDDGLVLLHGGVKKRPSRIVFQTGHGVGLASHEDFFQILWDVGGVEVLADPGSDVTAPTDRAFAGARAHGQLLYRGQGLPARGACVDATLTMARSDGRDASMVAEHGAFEGVIHRRDVRVGGARITVSDHLDEGANGEVEIRWPLGPDWSIDAIEGSECEAVVDNLTLKIKLAPELSWTVESGEVIRAGLRRTAPILIGRGRAQGAVRYRSSFELR